MKYAIFILISILLSGCYSQKKARQQVYKADAVFPVILAEYCRDKFPVIERIVKGDSVFVIDTVYDVFIFPVDSVISIDTVDHRITIIKTVPGKTITVTKTITRVDTIWQKNTAEIKACEIVKNQAVQLATDKTAEAAKYKKRAQTLAFISIGLLLAAGVWTYFKTKSLFTKK